MRNDGIRRRSRSRDRGPPLPSAGLPAVPSRPARTWLQPTRCVKDPADSNQADVGRFVTKVTLQVPQASRCVSHP